MEETSTIENFSSDTGSAGSEHTSAHEIASQESHENLTQEQKSEVLNPFAAGKAKFKVDGQEYEADWDTVTREYQLTKKSRMMMDEAAGIKRKAETALKNLYAAARNSPEEFLRSLNPNWNPQRSQGQAPAGQEASGAQAQGQFDLESLREQIRSELMQDVAPIKQQLEQYELERERQSLDKEFGEVTDKFPVFKGRVEKQFLMSQYRAALEQETNLSLEEVAFIASRELEEERKESMRIKAERAQQLRQKAPVTTRPAGGEPKKEMTLEDVKRIAGRM